MFENPMYSKIITWPSCFFFFFLPETHLLYLILYVQAQVTRMDSTQSRDWKNVGMGIFLTHFHQDFSVKADGKSIYVQAGKQLN